MELLTAFVMRCPTRTRGPHAPCQGVRGRPKADLDKMYPLHAFNPQNALYFIGYVLSVEIYTESTRAKREFESRFPLRIRRLAKELLTAFVMRM